MVEVQMITQKSQLLQFIRTQPYVKSHDVKRWGLASFIGCPGRRLRELVREGKVKRLSKLEAQEIGYTGREAVYEVVRKETQVEMFG